MADRKLARRYAYSLLGLADERGVMDRVFDDMALVSQTCNDSREFSVFLKNPVIHSDKKDSVINALFSDKVSEISYAFMQIITRKRRESYLEGIAAEYVAMYKNKKGISTAQIISAAQIDTELREEMISFLIEKTKRKIELAETVDPDIIGGFILRWGDEQVDASISRKLRDLRRSFKPNLYIKDF